MVRSVVLMSTEFKNVAFMIGNVYLPGPNSSLTVCFHIIFAEHLVKFQYLLKQTCNNEHIRIVNKQGRLLKLYNYAVYTPGISTLNRNWLYDAFS